MRATLIASAFLVLLSLTEGAINKAYNEKAINYCKLTGCDYHNEYYYEELKFYPLNNVTNSQPDGYVVRFPVTIIGSSNGQIILTETNEPNWDQDWAYGFLLGGRENARVVIRRKKSSAGLADISTTHEVLSRNNPTKFWIEITKSGFINVYRGNDTTPYISAFDPNPISVKYVTFVSYEGSQTEYFYNCPSDKDALPPQAPEQPTSVSAADFSTAPLDHLVAKCELDEVWRNGPEKIFNLSDIENSQPDGFKVKFQTYLLHSGESSVKLAVSPHSEDYYRIAIDNRQGLIRLLRVNLYAYNELKSAKLSISSLSHTKQVLVNIQISNSGLIEVYYGHSTYKAMLSYYDKNPLDVKYVSFITNGYNDVARALFFFRCPIHETILPVNELLANDSGNVTKNSLIENCTTIQANDYIFPALIELSLIKNITTDGFLIRLPFYVEGHQDAHILLTTGYGTKDRNFYEFIIGTLNNSQTLVRKNHVELAKVQEYAILDRERPVKFVLEISRAGTIRIFTEYNKMKPLLEVEDTTPITDLEYISFSDRDRHHVFFCNCSQISNNANQTNVL